MASRAEETLFCSSHQFIQTLQTSEPSSLYLNLEIWSPLMQACVMFREPAGCFLSSRLANLHGCLTGFYDRISSENQVAGPLLPRFCVVLAVFPP